MSIFHVEELAKKIVPVCGTTSSDREEEVGTSLLHTIQHPGCQCGQVKVKCDLSSSRTQGSQRGEYLDAVPGNDDGPQGFHEDREAYAELVVAGLFCAHVL